MGFRPSADTQSKEVPGIALHIQHALCFKSTVVTYCFAFLTPAFTEGTNLTGYIWWMKEAFATICSFNQCSPSAIARSAEYLLSFRVQFWPLIPEALPWSISLELSVVTLCTSLVLS